MSKLCVFYASISCSVMFELSIIFTQLDVSSFGNSAAVRAFFCLLLSLVYGEAQPYWRLRTAITPTGFLLPVTSLFERLSSRNCESFLYTLKLVVLSFVFSLPQLYINSVSIPVKLLNPIIDTSLSFIKHKSIYISHILITHS